VTVGTEQPQVLQAVVGAVTVDVVELERDRPTLPVVQAALLATVSLQTGEQQPALDVLPASGTAGGEHVIESL
jgi:hypothetical protein